MNSTQHSISAVIVSGFLCLVAQAVEPTAKAPVAATVAAKQKTFATPELAASSLIEAAASYDAAALKEILGPDSGDIISSEDPVMDKERALAFVAKAKEKQAIEIDPKKPDLATLAVGEDAFPLPIPIVKKKGAWSFDTKAGIQEILNRRIGANELDAIAICRGYDDAQLEYATKKHDDSKVNQYAQRIISTPGKQDGLAWQNAEGNWEGPIGEGTAKALQQGYSQKDKPQPYHGYYFKILKGQGPAAPMGQLDYVVGGAMIGGFALAAAPAQYQVTGVKTFIVSNTGIVYEKDLGPQTLDAFEKMELFNPDKTWTPTEDQW
ncbi:MAG: DUF2950 domain-containing protein [Gloeobacteraceae cyanobacterium ES-bin-144]|nr:DUF2950 domain-containing protein [Verrucomicrobiales bacterium]